MSKKFLALLIFLGLGAYLIYGNFFKSSISELPNYTLKVEKAAKSPAKKEIVAPAPLRAKKEAPTADINLTAAGVLAWTNQERARAGLPDLLPRSKLSASALAKVRDMFNKQYFAHESPTGEGVGDLVEKEGYEYIVVGENLALGNFEGDKVLVAAWMASPGHRANILGDRYKEIGIAVGRGIFEGRETWLAVQHFGLPLSACPKPDENLKSGIESFEAQINDLSIKASAFRTELKVDEYNTLAKQINSLIEQVKGVIAVYNQQIKMFNQCVGAE